MTNKLTMRKKIVAGNWKMNNDYFEGLKLASEVIGMISDEVNSDVICIMAPPFIHLNSIAQLIKGKKGISLAAQNCSDQDSGAYTGEVSAKMISSTGATYVIIGHSERRNYFAEDAVLLQKKVNIALQNKLIPIFCIGETLSQRESGKHFELVKQQLVESLFSLSTDEFNKVIIAYEPVWAIGTGLTASPAQAQEMHAFIRETIAGKYGQAIANDKSILYGGSCNPTNAKELFAQSDIDGGLIGGASLKSRDFVNIVKSF